MIWMTPLNLRLLCGCIFSEVGKTESPEVGKTFFCLPDFPTFLTINYRTYAYCFMDVIRFNKCWCIRTG